MKGLREQIVEASYTPLSVSKLKGYLMDIFRAERKNEVKFVQYCIMQGFIERTPSDLKLCYSDECGSCNFIRKAINDHGYRKAVH